MKPRSILLVLITLLFVSGSAFSQRSFDRVDFSLINLPCDYIYIHGDSVSTTHPPKTTYGKEQYSESGYAIFDTSYSRDDTNIYFDRGRQFMVFTVLDSSSSNYSYLRLRWAANGYETMDAVFNGLEIQGGIQDSQFVLVRGTAMFQHLVRFADSQFADGYIGGFRSINHIYNNWDSTYSDSGLFEFKLSKQKSSAPSISSSLESKLSVVPNPTNSTIWIRGLSPFFREKLYVFDFIGRPVLVLSSISNENEPQIDISSLPPGIYYLRAGNQMQKFVIQR